jgi:hypothetical protein
MNNCEKAKDFRKENYEISPIKEIFKTIVKKIYCI